MKIATILGVALLSAATAAAQAGGAQGQGTGRGTGRGTAQAKGANAVITAVADAYVKAVLAGDAKGVAALYTEDAIEMPPNQPMIKGRVAILQYYEKVLGGGMKVTSFTLDHIETHVSGVRAYDVGTYRQNMTPPNATAAGTETGKYVVILQREAGAWKVAYAIYSSDQPPAPGR